MHKPAQITACVLFATLCFSKVVLAQSTPTAEQQALAERLFREAKANMDQGRYEKACPQLEESMRQDPGGGTQLTLALCYEGAGRTASAWAAYLEAEAQARRDGRADREVIAQERAAALEPRLINLSVTVPPQVAQLSGFKLTRNGVEIPKASFGVPAPIDPGEHQLVASADDHEPWTFSLQASEQNKQPSVSVPALNPTPPEVAPSDLIVPGPTPVSERERDVPPVQRDDGLSQRSWGYIVGSVGVASLAVGTIFGIRAIDKANTVNDACPERECDRRFEGDFAAWETASRVADITVGLGLVGVGVGAYMIVSAKDEPELSISAVPTTAGASLQVRRAF
jgi:serine/threonine-protein kinase